MKWKKLLSKKKVIEEKPTINYFNEFNKVLTSSTSSVINNFVKSDENNNVYVLVLDIDEVHGSIQLLLNSEVMLEDIIKSKYSNYNESQIRGLSGLKYSEGAFKFRVDLSGSEFEKMNELLSKYYNLQINDNKLSYDDKYNYRVKFKEFCVANLNLMDLSNLNVTDDFLCYVISHDVSEEEKLDSIMASNTVSQVNKCFPELILGANYLENIKALGSKVYTHFLVTSYVNFLITTDYELKEQLEKLNFTRFKIGDELLTLKEDAVNSIFDVLPQYIHSPYKTYCILIPIMEFIKYNNSLPEDEKISNSKPIETEVSTSLLLLLVDIGILSSSQEEYLVGVIKEKLVIYKDFETKDLRITLAARALHSAFPKKYPSVKIGGKNEFLNKNDFGL